MDNITQARALDKPRLQEKVRLLETYLKIGFDEPRGPALERIVDRAIRPIERQLGQRLGAWHDDKLVPVRELLLTTDITGTTLIQSEMHNAVTEGAKPAVCMRQALPTFEMAGPTRTFPYGSTGTYARKVAEGAEIPISNQDYTALSFTAEKYAERPMITDEMIEDSAYDVMALEIAYAGESVENALNQQMLTELLDGVTLEHNASGSNVGVKAVNSAVGLVEKAGFMADTLLMCSVAKTAVTGELIPTSYVGADQVMRGQLPPICGLQTWLCNVADASSTYIWDYDTTGDIGMLVVDSRKVGGIGMRRDITVEDCRDPVRQIKGVTVSARFDCDTGHGAAGARVKY